MDQVAEKTHENQGIQVITRAADILRLLGRETGGLSLGQIAKQVQLPRSTVQRIVSALQIEGLVSIRNGGRGIMLGPEIRVLAEAAKKDADAALRSALAEISAETGETIDLAVFDGRRMLFVEQVVGTQRLRTVSTIGETFPLSTTANGKAVLAQLNEADAMRLHLAEVESGEAPERDISDFLAMLSKVKQRNGLAFDQDEHTDGISAIGFAIKSDDGRIIAISAPVPSHRFRRLKPQLAKVFAAWRERLAAGSRSD